MYKQSSRLLQAIAATGANGCDDMFPTATSDKWIYEQAIQCWQRVRDGGLDTPQGVVVPEEPCLRGIWKVRCKPTYSLVDLLTHMLYCR